MCRVARRPLVYVALAVAASVLVGFVLAERTAKPVDAPVKASFATAHRDVACAIPDDWAAYLVVARFDAPTAKQVVASDGLFNEVRATIAPLGDVFVQFQSDACIWGGSACTGASRSLHHVRVGPLDEYGVPSVGSAFACAGTSDVNRQPGDAKRSCDPDSLRLRRAPDGRTFVLTMRDPDALETPISAFSRD